MHAKMEDSSGAVLHMSGGMAMHTSFEPKAIYLLPGLCDLQSQTFDVRFVLADFSLHVRAQGRKQQHPAPQGPWTEQLSVEAK
jgi:hypothetical protein